jgi:hypothetical protein
VALATALLLNVGHYGRNLEVFGHPLGPRSEGLLNYANDAITPPLLVSNLLRNVSLQLDTRTPVLNRGIVATVRRAHDMVGLDPNDPRTTWSNLVFDGPRPSTDADTAGNLWHFLLTVLVVLLVAFAPPLPVHRAYSWALMAAFLLFCAYLRWQPWHTRLHLPLFVLAAPLVSVLLCSRLPPRGSGAVGALLVLWALPLVLMNPTSPLLGPRSVFRVARQAQYFRNWPDLESPYRRAVRTVTAANCTDVGLYEDVRWEYPLWPLFRAQASHVRIEHVGVTNASGSLAQREPFRSFSPCAVISFQPNAATSLRLGQLVYDRASSGAGVTVFLSSGRERK